LEEGEGRREQRQRQINNHRERNIIKKAVILNSGLKWNIDDFHRCMTSAVKMEGKPEPIQ